MLFEGFFPPPLKKFFSFPSFFFKAHNSPKVFSQKGFEFVPTKKREIFPNILGFFESEGKKTLFSNSTPIYFPFFWGSLFITTTTLKKNSFFFRCEKKKKKIWFPTQKNRELLKEMKNLPQFFWGT